MNKYCIMIWNAAGNSMGSPDDVKIIEAETYDDAIDYAYDRAIENYDSYGGLHGLTQEGDPCEDCSGSDEDCPYCGGTGVTNEETAHEIREGNLKYKAEIYNPNVHDEMFENLGLDPPESS
jgi:hypothetical protein